MTKEGIRILVYLLVLFLHVGNMMYLGQATKEKAPTLSPETLTLVMRFQRFWLRFLTTWTELLQVFYATIGILYDLVLWKNSNKKNYKPPQIITEFFNFIYSGLVWPSTCLVFSVFWCFFLYDRSLIFQKYLDEIIPPLSNHIMHSAILPIAVLELLLRPRTEPENHKRNVVLLMMYFTGYFCVMISTYLNHDVWLYPIFGKVYGTIYFPLLIIASGLLFLMYYYIQWPFAKYIHGSSRKTARRTIRTD